MTFVLTGDVVSLEEFMARGPPEPSKVYIIEYQDSATQMLKEMFDAAKAAYETGTAAIVIVDPMGVTMTNAAGERVCENGAKPVIWSSLEPHQFLCRDGESGAVGVLVVTDLHAPRVVYGLRSGRFAAF